MFKTFCIFIFILKLSVVQLVLRCIALKTNSTLEYLDRLYYIPLAFLEGYFCNLHSVRVSSKIFMKANLDLSWPESTREIYTTRVLRIV